eukprot:4710478-Pleurochrysis_carterae.AAC.1
MPKQLSKLHTEVSDQRFSQTNALTPKIKFCLKQFPHCLSNPYRVHPTSNRGTEAYYLVNATSEAPLFECEPISASMPRQALSTARVVRPQRCALRFELLHDHHISKNMLFSLFFYSNIGIWAFTSPKCPVRMHLLAGAEHMVGPSN